MTDIHATALVSPKAEIGSGVKVGAYCVIGEHVKIGSGTVLDSHVVIEGRTSLGENNHVYPFAILGKEPQDAKYKGEKSTLTIGSGNTIREHVTIHVGTSTGEMKTIIGNNNALLVGSHVAHDSVLGNNIVMVNGTMTGGHVVVGDYAYIGGNSAIRQFVRIGEHAMIFGMCGVVGDVIPFGLARGQQAVLGGLNLIGMKRRGFNSEQIRNLRQLYKVLFEGEGHFIDRLEKIKAEHQHSAEVKLVLDFIDECDQRPLCHPSKV